MMTPSTTFFFHMSDGKLEVFFSKVPNDSLITSHIICDVIVKEISIEGIVHWLLEQFWPIVPIRIKLSETTQALRMVSPGCSGPYPTPSPNQER